MAFAIPLILFLIPLAFSPGPGNLYFAALSARFGARTTMPALMGYHIATLLVTFVVGLGLELGTGDNSVLTRTFGSVGALYVLYLAWKLATSEISDAPKVANVARFRDGFVLLVFNPKAYVIIALLFTQFPPSRLLPDMPVLAALIIAGAFTLHNLLAFIVWIFASDKIGSGFRAKENMQRMNLVFGGLLALVAVWLLVSNWV